MSFAKGTAPISKAADSILKKLEEDGMATTIGAPGIFGSPARDGHNITDLAMYDHIEVVRGAAGLTQSNSAPGGTINAVRKKTDG